MIKIENNELVKINGGGLTAAYLNAAARAVNTLLDFGRTVGSSIRRMVSRKYC